jgi:hypothetical protein
MVKDQVKILDHPYKNAKHKWVRLDHFSLELILAGP